MPHFRSAFIFVWSILTSTYMAGQHSFNAAADSIFSSWKGDNKPGGAVAVIKNGKTIYESVNGMANIATGRRIGYDTQFWIASLTKQFTAAAIYLLAAENKITVKDPVTKYLTSLPKIYDGVTIDHLLHHTSGIKDAFTPAALLKKPETEFTNDNVLKYLIKQKKLNFKPGDQYEYNNSGYVLLALIIEKVSKETYPEFLQFHIFVPAGMNNTFVTGKYENNGVLAEGYRNYNGSYEATHFFGNTYGSTGIITTLRDLELWSAQFQSLSTTNRFNAVFRKMKETIHLNNGQAIEKLKYNGMEVYEHFGTDEGFKASIIYFPSSNVTVIGLTNNMNDDDLTARLYSLAELAFQER